MPLPLCNVGHAPNERSTSGGRCFDGLGRETSSVLWLLSCSKLTCKLAISTNTEHKIGKYTIQFVSPCVGGSKMPPVKFI